MIPAVVVRLAAGALVGRRLRSLLTLAAMSIGVAAVVALTGLGEGARRYVTGEFATLGTNLLVILPGRSETVGGPPPLLGETPRDLTLEDALALRRLPGVRQVAPVTLGSAPVNWGARERESVIVGTTAEFQSMRRIVLAGGRFLPAGNPRRADPVCVIGPKIREGLFGARPALGQWVRIGDRRFEVIGVLASRGRSFGFDLDDLVLAPVATVQSLFNTHTLFRVLAEAHSRDEVNRAADEIRAAIKKRHENEEDVTVIAQDALLATFDRILRALTLTLGGIAAISLGVAGILIMNVMLVAVTERTEEIGLLKAVGGSRRDILTLFLAEATALALAGGALGLAAGRFLAWGARQLYPALPIQPPGWAVAAALAVAAATGLIFGILPARRAARLDPVGALARR